MFFFFSSRRRHTRYWRDWSSDVCSSDLPSTRWQARRSCRRKCRLSYMSLECVTASSRRGRRSEERRVGKECRSRWSPDQLKKKNNRTEGEDKFVNISYKALQNVINRSES